MTHEYCFYFKALSGSIGSNFPKINENNTVKMTDIKIVKVDKCSPYTFSFKMSYSQENYKKDVVNNRRKTKSEAAQLNLQPVYSRKLRIGDKKKADFLDLLGKNHIPKFYATFYESYFNNYYNIQGIIHHFCILFLS